MPLISLLMPVPQFGPQFQLLNIKSTGWYGKGVSVTNWLTPANWLYQRHLNCSLLFCHFNMQHAGITGYLLP